MRAENIIREILVQLAQKAVSIEYDIRSPGHLEWRIRERDKAVEEALEEITKADASFILHIQAHLTPNQKVICKICGKSAKEIIGVRQ